MDGRQKYPTNTQHRNKPIPTLQFIQTPPTPNPNPNRKTPDFTFIQLMLVRLKEQGTDLMISINVPHYKGEYEEAKEGDGGVTKLMEESEGWRERILGSFVVREWGLFDG